MSITTTGTRMLVALDIDGTLVDTGNTIPSGTVEALDLVRAAGHEVVLATGRSLAGLGPIAVRLGLTTGWGVCSNGALTVRLDRSMPSAYAVVAAHIFDPRPLIRRALEVVPTVRVAVEEVGWGWHTNHPFEPDELNGQQKLVSLEDLMSAPATRVALVAPGIRRFTDALHATGVTVAPMGPDWLDITARDVNKAAALDGVREYLNIPADRTVAVGDGVNDLDMLAWAARSVAMGHAPADMRLRGSDATYSSKGSSFTVRPYRPRPCLNHACEAGFTCRDRPDRARVAVVLVLVRAEARPAGSRGIQTGRWIRHAPIRSGVGTTMRAIEAATLEAGLPYPRGDEGRRRAQWRSVTGPGPAGFELPLSGPTARSPIDPAAG